MSPDPEHAALFALLRESKSWARAAADVAYEGSAVEVWRQREGDGLFASPTREALLAEAEQQVAGWLSQGLRFVTVLDREYPRRLRDIAETPPFLFYDGALAPDEAGLSVVGSRDVGEASLRLAGDVARLLVDEGLTVISGLAAGIDSAAHRAALEASGRTVAFIGTGISKTYPAQNNALQREIAERGLVLSQFYPDAPPTKKTFPMRNVSMSGYGIATIVVDAGERSGTRIQARRATEHGRPVILAERVATGTTWGKDLTELPGVHVFSGLEGLADAVAEVQRSFEEMRQAVPDLASW